MKRAGVIGGIIVAVALAAASVVAVRLLNDAERVSAAGGMAAGDRWCSP